MRNLWNLCIHMAVNAVYLDEFLPEQCSDKTTFSYDLQPRNFPQSSEISRFLFAEGQDCSNIQIQY